MFTQKWNKVDVLNDKNLEVWTFVLVFGFWILEFSHNFYEYNSINGSSNQQHRLRYVWVMKIFPFLEEWIRFRLITKKSETNNTSQKVDDATLHSAGHVRIIVYNVMWLILLWMW